MEAQTQINQILEVIKQDKNSPLSTFINMEPNDDMIYLNLWFYYFDFSVFDKDFIIRYLNEIGGKADDFIFHYKLNIAFKEMLDQTLKEKLDKMSFQPRLEIYLAQFEPEERENIRKLILAYLYKIYKDESKFINLIELASEFQLPQAFILSLSKQHPLLKDKIIEMDDDSLSSDEAFHQKEIISNVIIYSIFAGLEVNEEDLAILRDSSLLPLFGLSAGDYLRDSGENNNRKDPFSSEEQDEEFQDDESEIDLDITKLYGEGEDAEDEDNELSEQEVIDQEVDEKSLSAYADNLEYLHEESRLLKMIYDLKEKQNDDMLIHEKENERTMHVMQQKIEKQRNICEIRLNKSIEKGFTPRLEKLARRMKLSVFEKNILIYLTVDKIFPKYDKRFGENDVKTTIMLLLDDPIQQVKAKNYFLKNARLVKTGLLKVEQNDSLNNDFFDNTVVVDNRLIEYLIGENYNISDYIEGSYLYHSSVHIDSVVLPAEIKGKVLTTINNFPSFLSAKDALKFSEIVEYGNALAMLFVGKSGTGKTMLANAISNHLNKKILLFNFNNLSQMQSMMDDQQVFSVLFREARMNDAILFFDESEAILENRLNDLLIEIEKHEGIVIFATNAEFSIDDAMRRRINLIINLPDPGPGLRREIWKNHLPEKLNLDENVDLDQLAKRYELNGGLIKNAVFSALFQAVNENGTQKPAMKMEHLEYGARDQLQNKLFMSNMQRMRVPHTALEDIVLRRSDLDQIREIVNIEKSRKVLEGQWGFDEIFPDHKGVAVLFHGPSGTGKTITAEAIAYEMGKKLKIVNYSQVLSMFIGGTEKALESLFKEVADSESILLFDEADALFAKRTPVSHSNDRYANVETDVLLSLVERYNTFTILTTNYLDNIDKAFYRRMSYIIEFNIPTEKERVKLWKKLTPKKLPLAEDVNFNKLARDHEFTGGDIRNVIIRAATHKAGTLEKDVVVNQEDFETFCNEIKKAKANGREKIGF